MTVTVANPSDCGRVMGNVVEVVGKHLIISSFDGRVSIHSPAPLKIYVINRIITLSMVAKRSLNTFTTITLVMPNFTMLRTGKKLHWAIAVISLFHGGLVLQTNAFRRPRIA
jgi:hypothetical protein